MKKVIFSLVILMAGVLQACIDDPMLSTPADHQDKVSVSLLLRTPFDTYKPASRAVDADVAASEKSIRSLSVLVFLRQTGKDGKTTDRLAYQAEATAATGGDGLYATTVTLKRSVAEETYNVMVIANRGETVGYSLVGKSREEVQQALTFAYGGAWETTDGKNNPFPMWGEYYFGQITGNQSQGANTTIYLLRATARVDVGLNFTPGDGGSADSEAFAGLSGWSLQNVRLYRTRTKASVMPLDQNYNATGKKVTAPTVPSDATLNHAGATGSTADGGAVYSSPNVTGDVSKLAAASVHQIYLPENGATPDKETTAVVVGLKNETTGKLSYFRVDIAGNQSTAASVLRNYRYIFNITGVNGPGFNNPDDALDAVRTDLTYSVIAWNEGDASNLWMSGNYYFRVDKREVVLPARKLSSYAAPEYQLTYETNLPLEEITWKWTTENPSFGYTATEPTKNSAGDYTGSLLFTANDDNTGTQDIVNKLAFTAGKISGDVTVRQLFIPMDYKIDCTTGVTVKGVFYVDDVPDAGGAYSSTHYIEVELSNISSGMIGEEWSMHTQPDAGNLSPLTFSGTGKFETIGRQRVRLYMDKALYGTALKPAQKLRFKLIANSTLYSDDNGVACDEFNVPIAFHRKKILGIGWRDRSGLGYFAESGASRGFLESTFFSLNGTQGVPIDGLDFDCDNAIVDPIPASFIANMVKKVQEKPDIILASNLTPSPVAGGVATFQPLANALVDYVNAGGVLFVYSGTARFPSQSNLQNCWDGLLTWNNSVAISGGLGSHFQFNYYKNHDFEANDGGTEALKERLLVDPDDPIYSGNIEGVQYFPRLDAFNDPDGNQYAYWGNAVVASGETGQYAKFVDTNVATAPYDKLVIYSFGGYAASTNPSTYARYKYFNFFRYKPKNLLYIGDGGWIGTVSKEPEDSANGDTYEASEAMTHDRPFAVEWTQTEDGWVVSGLKSKAYQATQAGQGTGLPGAGQVHNSYIFANTMAWAIYQAEFHGINSGGL
ncbi:MAG: hypothetical protein LBM06_00500 [Prevotellaceae bacterium]|jgi:hypothetical protein|nr:hypothetical protein [Prevotellaceae bacterium]